MPWSNNQGGGGGPWGGGGGSGGGPGPWGRPPGGGGGGGPFGSRPPDFEDVIRRGQERLKNLLPKGGFGSGRGLALAGLVLVAAWLASGFYRVQPNEVGVILTFGKYTGLTQPGLNWRWPAPIQSVLTPRVTTVNSIDVGFRAPAEARGARSRVVGEESLMLTGDENIIDIQYTVFWLIKNAEQFLFNIASPETTVKQAAESAMREVVGQMEATRALAEDRAKIEASTHKLLQEILDQYGAGVQVTQVQLRIADPPGQVIDAFRDVQRAKADRERARNEAEAYRNDIVPRARGEAQRLIQEAEAYRQQVIAQAQGEAEKFNSVFSAYRLAPEVTRQRLYLETMESVLRGNSKVIIDQTGGGPGVVPYLPLPEMQRRLGPPPAPGAATPAPGAAAPGVQTGARP